MSNILNHIKTNPLQNKTEEEKIMYLSILSTIAMADGKVLDEEIEMINKLCDISDISQKAKKKILQFMQKPNNEKITEKYIQKIAITDLKYSLIVNMFFLAFSDFILLPQELRKIKDTAKSLNIPIEDVKDIKNYVKFAIKVKI
ncbi:MAG: hypothetical protein QM536_08535 [Chitinophagaceae bacterium]|nr:hypothetical protein [Chitinophagaceae bacterium]